jgi:hypothetical protein
LEEIMRIATGTLTAAACAALLLLSGCGGGGVTSPSSSSSPGAGGSTIVGIVSGGAAATALSAGAGPSGNTALTGLSVTIVGTNLSSSVDSQGRFELTSVPSGTVRLQFKDATVNATVQISNVGPDDLIQIRVTVSGSAATLVGEERSTGKVSLCHNTESGSYHMIEVSVSAEPAHRAHGDAKVGEPVPADPTRVFDSQCRVVGASVKIEKSTNGHDADDAPGPTVLVGSPISWTYVVTNNGTVNLTNVAVADDHGVAVNCGGQTVLAPEQSFTCTGSGVAALGQYRNVGTVTASWTGGTVSDSDASHYLGVTPGNEEEGPKVQLCHRTGNGSYHLIEVSMNAEPAHIAHGDGRIGAAVPGSPGKVFGAGCSVQ